MCMVMEPIHKAESQVLCKLHGLVYLSPRLPHTKGYFMCMGGQALRRRQERRGAPASCAFLPGL